MPKRDKELTNRYNYSDPLGALRSAFHKVSWARWKARIEYDYNNHSILKLHNIK
jgi:hypothetical protein